MTKSDIIASIDMGSGRVTCILAVHDQKQIVSKFYQELRFPARGLKVGWLWIFLKQPML